MSKKRTFRFTSNVWFVSCIAILTTSVANAGTPIDVTFDYSTLHREGHIGDNWCQTWAADDTVITAMDDGAWTEMTGPPVFHSMLYKITGEADSFTKERVVGYPYYDRPGDGWFAYGLVSVDGVLYSTVSKTQGDAWAAGPFRGIKMLRSYDSGATWYRVNKDNEDLLLDGSNSTAARTARELLTDDEMFFFEESERLGKGKFAAPFGSVSFVQNGRDHSDSPDGYVYIYSPEGANAHELLLARAPAPDLGLRSAWEYFSGWDNGTAQWSSDIEDRQPNLLLPEKNAEDEYFGWYSWLPSVVWNPGLQLYIMVNGGTYAGDNLTNSTADYYDRWMHTKTGSLGFWYSENPYGPWQQFYYTDYWTVDPDEADGRTDLTYQPKLSPKWMSEDGQTMTLIWSDAKKNAQGSSHAVNYLWNQMEINILIEEEPEDESPPQTFIADPATSNLELTPSPTLSGYATDEGGAGFDNVRIAIKEMESGDWLDFNTGGFTSSFKHTQAQLVNTSENDTDWFIDTSLQTGDYKLFALAFDGVGNHITNAAGSKVYTTRLFSVAEADVYAPDTRIEIPVTNEVLAVAPTLSGYATDEGGAGFDNVRIAIKDTESNTWLNFDSGNFTQSFSHTTALLENTTDADTDWSIETSLQAGQYKLFALAFDQDGNHDQTASGAKKYQTRLFSVADENTDNIAPLTFIENPATNIPLPSSPTLSGSATDEGGAGFSHVRIAIKDTISNDWLNFDSGSFTQSFSHTTAALENTTGTDTDWSIDTSLQAGQYKLFALAFDQDGNHDQTTSGAKKYQTQLFSVASEDIDSIAPLTFIEYPASNIPIPSAPSLSGRATDEGGAGFSNVRLALKNVDSNEWLDFDSGGFTSSFSHTTANLENTTTTDTDWSIDTSLQAGQYKLFAVAIDTNGNYATNAAGSRIYTTQRFSIE